MKRGAWRCIENEDGQGVVREKNKPPPRRRRAVSDLLHHQAKIDNPLSQLIRALHYHHCCHHKGRPRRLEALSWGEGGLGRCKEKKKQRRKEERRGARCRRPTSGDHRSIARRAPTLPDREPPPATSTVPRKPSGSPLPDLRSSNKRPSSQPLSGQPRSFPTTPLPPIDSQHCQLRTQAKSRHRRSRQPSKNRPKVPHRS